MKSFKQHLREQKQPNIDNHVNDFVGFAADHLNLAGDIPQVHLVRDKKHAKDNTSFGGYYPHERKIKVNVAGRHPVDVLRTLAHELVHHKQNIEGRLSGANVGETGSEHENEANAVAGIMMRNYGKSNPHLFESKEYMTQRMAEIEVWTPIEHKLGHFNHNKNSGHINESFATGGGHLHMFDIDDTLFHTTAKVKVMKGNKEVASLSNSEYNTHKLPKGHHYDFSEFKDAKKFREESTPVKRMVAKLKAIHSNVKARPNHKIVFNTARADFDNKHEFLHTFKKHGIDIDKIHVHRAGNIQGPQSVAEKKAHILRQHLRNGNFKKVSVYDDNKENLCHFLGLKKEFPHVQFTAHHVQPNGTTIQHKVE